MSTAPLVGPPAFTAPVVAGVEVRANNGKPWGVEVWQVGGPWSAARALTFVLSGDEARALAANLTAAADAIGVEGRPA